MVVLWQGLQLLIRHGIHVNWESFECRFALRRCCPKATSAAKEFCEERQKRTRACPLLCQIQSAFDLYQPCKSKTAKLVQLHLPCGVTTRVSCNRHAFLASWCKRISDCIRRAEGQDSCAGAAVLATSKSTLRQVPELQLQEGKAHMSGHVDRLQTRLSIFGTAKMASHWQSKATWTDLRLAKNIQPRIRST